MYLPNGFTTSIFFFYRFGAKQEMDKIYLVIVFSFCFTSVGSRLIGSIPCFTVQEYILKENRPQCASVDWDKKAWGNNGRRACI